MKKHLLLLTFSILGLTTLRAQTSVYHPFPTSNAIWTEYSNVMGTISKSQYAIFGDTIINSYTFHKIYSRNLACFDTSITTSNSTLTGAIREDSLKRVYYYPFNTGIFCQADTTYKLYDFSKQTPGDTIQFDTTSSTSCYPFHYLTINYVDSILINSTFRKMFHFVEGETWIEGIGSTRALLSTITPYPICSCTLALLCNKQSDFIFYMNPIYNYCYCNNGVGINDIEKEEFSVFPNPFSISTIMSTNKNFTNSILTIYNALGQRVKRIENISGREIIIHRDDLPNGVYYLRLTEGDKIFATEKLVIVDK